MLGKATCCLLPLPASEARGVWGGGHLPGPQLGAGGSWPAPTSLLSIFHQVSSSQAAPLSLCPPALG